MVFIFKNENDSGLCSMLLVIASSFACVSVACMWYRCKRRSIFLVLYCVKLTYALHKQGASKRRARCLVRFYCSLLFFAYIAHNQ